MSKDNTVEEIILEICKRDGYSDAEANDVLAMFYSEPAIVEALTTFAEQIEEEAWSASELLWDRMTEWNKEWQSQNPGNELTMKDAMFLIQWKMEQVRKERDEEIIKFIETELPNSQDLHHLVIHLQALSDKSV